ncbi:MBL fold metallo-hydrolase [Flavobacteriaceae bacterium]|nr:MBL fold metallo-hydrolase [Flavobacteriaceae bacterium]
MGKLVYLFVFLIFFSCEKHEMPNQFITVLGNVQDAGYPHIGCEENCCNKNFNSSAVNFVTSLGVTDLVDNKSFLFEATPDISKQLKFLNNNYSSSTIVDGVFITHAHIGHYTGLMYFGREALGAHKVPVYVMPKMKQFLESNSPWNQLIDLDNVQLREIFKNKKITISKNLIIVPFTVPHRDEFSETVGYKIIGPNKSALFIPDINKWSLWNKDIVAEVKDVDYAFLDATFFKDGEVNRPMDEIPHPFIVETINLFKNESIQVKNKIHFIHFNHTNISLQYKNPVIDSIRKLGYNFARFGDQLSL